MIKTDQRKSLPTRILSKILVHWVSTNRPAIRRPRRVFLLEAVDQRCSVNNVFIEISQNLQENTCARVSFLIKLQA